MGMDAHIYVKKVISPRIWEDYDNFFTNPQFIELCEAIGISRDAVIDTTSIVIDVPVAYFRKDYVLHYWIGENIEDADVDEYGGFAADLSRDDLYKMLAFVQSDEYAQQTTQYHVANANTMILRALHSTTENNFSYSAG